MRDRDARQEYETETEIEDRDTRLAGSWMTLCSIQATPSCPTRDKVGCEHGCSSGRRSQGTPGAEGEGLDLAPLRAFCCRKACHHLCAVEPETFCRVGSGFRKSLVSCEPELVVSLPHRRQQCDPCRGGSSGPVVLRCCPTYLGEDLEKELSHDTRKHRTTRADGDLA